MSTILAKIKREYNVLEASLSLIANQWAHAEDTRRLVAMESDGTTKRYYWDSTRLSDQTGAYGAALVGVLGITGVTPTGGSANASGTLQAMLEGVANGPTGAVILAPASSTRNTIQPTGDFKNLVLKMYASQTANPIELQDSTGTVLANFNSSGDLVINRASSAGSVALKLTNSSNTANSHAVHTLAVGGSAGGNPYTLYYIPGGGQFSAGVDNADSDKYKISVGGIIGTGNALNIDASGNVLVNSSQDTSKPRLGIGGDIGFGDGAGGAWTALGNNAGLGTSAGTTVRKIPIKYWDGSAWGVIYLLSTAT